MIIILFLLVNTNPPCGDAAVMEAMIQIDSDNFCITSFLQRFKRLIAQSHAQSTTKQDENTWIEKFVPHNDTFQANYDFSRNLLTMASSYSLLLNGTDQKISDINISITFKFNQATSEKIILEDMQGENAIPRIEYETRRLYESQVYNIQNEEPNTQTDDFTLLGRLLSHVVNLVEPIIVAFIHIIVNGVLGHFLTTAFHQLCNGRLITL